MNSKEAKVKKIRGSSNVAYLGRALDEMVYSFMEEHKIDGLSLAIVQAPYIPRSVGYGVSDTKHRTLASVNTLWPAGQISQAFAAVAVMQLVEQSKISLDDKAVKYIPELPASWADITVLQLLRHASGLPDYRGSSAPNTSAELKFAEIVALIKDAALKFTPGTEAERSATNFLLLTEIVERASGMSYRNFVNKNQIEYLGLKHTAFAEDFSKLNYENLAESEGVHQLFKKDMLYVNPAEPAKSYDSEGKEILPIPSSALRGFSDIWASAQDISFWDIALAGSILIHSPENRSIVYAPWTLPDGRTVPASAGWQFYAHSGFMDIKGSIPGYSSYLSRFTDPAELVCVTLLANKEGIDFTSLARRIAGALGDLLSTNYDDNKLFLYEGQLPVDATVKRLEKLLSEKNIPIFAKFDHAKNAEEAGLSLRPTTVLVFGAPKVGTALMQADQSVSLELPIKISVWEDEKGSTWLAFPRIGRLMADYSLEAHPVSAKLEMLLEELVRKAGDFYA